MIFPTQKGQSGPGSQNGTEMQAKLSCLGGGGGDTKAINLFLPTRLTCSSLKLEVIDHKHFWGENKII